MENKSIQLCFNATNRSNMAWLSQNIYYKTNITYDLQRCKFYCYKNDYHKHNT